MNVEKEELPAWFSYPSEYLFVVEHRLVDVYPWGILEGDTLRTWLRLLKEQYPEQDLVPLAKRWDSDDLSCWKKGNPYQIDVIDFSERNRYNPIKSYLSFWSWFKSAVDDMIDFTF